MNVQQLITALSTASEDAVGKYINQIANEYRRGGDLRTLVPLLTHSDSTYVSVGAWIASEVADGHRGREIFEELCSLLNHPDPAVRFSVVEAVATLVRPDEPSVVERLLLLAIDPNLGVRRHVLFYLCLIPDSVVQSLRASSLWPTARLLVANTDREQIRFAIKSQSALERRIAVAAALRNFGDEQDFIQELRPFLEDEVSGHAANLPRNRSFK